MAVTPSMPKFWSVRDWRIGSKMIAAFLLVSLVPTILITLIGVTLARESLVEQGDTNLRANAAHTSSAVDQYLNAHLEDVVQISLAQEVSAFTSDPRDAAYGRLALNTLKAASSKTDYDSVAIIDSSGTIVLSSAERDIKTNVQFRPGFVEALKGISSVSPPSISVITGRPAIFFSAPVRDAGGTIVGVVQSRLGLHGIWGLVEKDQDVAGPGTVGLLLDEYGIRVAHSSSRVSREKMENSLLFRPVAALSADAVSALTAEKRFANTAPETLPVRPLPEVAALLETSSARTFDSAADESAERHRAVIVPLETKPWHYVVMAPLPTFTNAANTFARFALTVAIVVGALSAIGALLFARAITDPIVQLTRVAERISLGHLDAKIDVERNDEIGELARAVRRMQASLQAAIERLRAKRPA